MNEITLGGKSYPLTYSANVACDVDDKFGSTGAMLEKLQADKLSDRLGTLAWLAAKMTASAARRLRADGAQTIQPPAEEEILDLLSLRDVAALQKAVMDTLIADTKRTVEAEPPKNA